MRLGGVLIEVHAEPREIGGDRRLVRRGLMQALQHVIEFSQLIILAINAVKGVERLPPQRWSSSNTRPQFIGFDGEIPVRGEAREFGLSVGLIASLTFGRTPERIEFGFATGLSRFARAQRLIGDPQVIRIFPRPDAGPTSKA